MTAPTRIDDDLFAAAQQFGQLMSRSAAQQVNHWARIGRAFELANGVSQRRIADVLAGGRHYDELSDDEQAVVRVEWAERISSARRDLDLASEFQSAGVPYVELDESGVVVRRGPAVAGEATTRR